MAVAPVALTSPAALAGMALAGHGVEEGMAEEAEATRVSSAAAGDGGCGRPNGGHRKQSSAARVERGSTKSRPSAGSSTSTRPPTASPTGCRRASMAFSSTDLVRWKDEGVILDLGPDIGWADNRARGAPGIAFKNGTYYLYFAANLGNRRRHLELTDRPIQRTPSGHPLVTRVLCGESIDPYAFTDDDGRSYLYFGSTSAGGHVVELNPDMISFKGTPQVHHHQRIQRGSVAFRRETASTTLHVVQGGTRSVRLRRLLIALGRRRWGHSRKLQSTPILQKKDTTQGILGTGHNSVLALPGGDYYIAYHRFAIPNGDGTHREVCLDRLYFQRRRDDRTGKADPLKRYCVVCVSDAACRCPDDVQPWSKNERSSPRESKLQVRRLEARTDQLAGKSTASDLHRPKRLALLGGLFVAGQVLGCADSGGSTDVAGVESTDTTSAAFGAASSGAEASTGNFLDRD